MLPTLQKIETPKAPKAIGPYSQAISFDNRLIFVSGQLPIDPLTGNLIEGDIRILTRRVLENIQAILHAGHSSMEQVLRVEIFLTNMQDFADMNEEYAKFVSKTHPPARQTIGVSALPKGASIEISCIAAISSG